MAYVSKGKLRQKSEVPTQLRSSQFGARAMNTSILKLVISVTSARVIFLNEGGPQWEHFFLSLFSTSTNLDPLKKCCQGTQNAFFPSPACDTKKGIMENWEIPPRAKNRKKIKLEKKICPRKRKRPFFLIWKLLSHALCDSFTRELGWKKKFIGHTFLGAKIGLVQTCQVERKENEWMEFLQKDCIKEYI